MLGFLSNISKKTVICFCFGYTFQDWIATPWYLEENSMEPALKSSQVVLTSPLLKTLKRGDIVIVKSPEDPKRHMCKRIKGKTRICEGFLHIEHDFRQVVLLWKF